MNASTTVEPVQTFGHPHPVVPADFTVLRTGEVMAYPFCPSENRRVLMYYANVAEMNADLAS